MHHNFFLRHCLTLAEHGRGKVKTNPLVGCVIVDDTNQIIAEGYHAKFGEEHAEVNALNNLLQNKTHTSPLHNVERARERLTLYISLEPCCTHGKQPPCTNLIIESGIKRVVFGAHDTSNSGANHLRKAGIEVIGPMMEAQCRRQNKGFFSLAEKVRPYVTLKKAMRKDGSTDGKITNEEQDEWSHTRLRATHDAILVGAGTVVADDPELNIRTLFEPCVARAEQGREEVNDYLSTLVRSGSRRAKNPFQPIRIILDPHSQLPSSAKVLTDEDSNRTIVIHEKLPIPELLDRLKEEGIASILVEGGPSVWKSFEESECVDEVVILTNKMG